MDPLIKSQLAYQKYQRLAGKLVALSGNTDQTVTIQMQTANWDQQALKPTEARWTPPGPDGQAAVIGSPTLGKDAKDGVPSTQSCPAVIEAPTCSKRFSVARPVSMIRAASQADHLGEFQSPVVHRG